MIGIAGLKGIEPIGAALSVGIKSPRGHPTRTDEFFLVAPREGDDKRRPLLPAFKRFNESPDKGVRQMMRGNLVHATRQECFEHHLKAQMQPGGKMHPDSRPWCVGDGKSAVRWMGPGADDTRTIVCPNERCEFRQSAEGKMSACRPWMRLVFRLRWPEGNPLPTPTVKYTSMGWLTIRGALGMFEALERAERHLGVTDCPLYGYPFTLSLTMRTQASRKRRYPVVDIVGEMDPVEWVGTQRERIRALQAAAPVASLASPEHQHPVVVEDDYRSINPAPVVIPGAG